MEATEIEEILTEPTTEETSNGAPLQEVVPTMPMRFQSIEMVGVGPFAQQRIEFPPCPSNGKAEVHIFTGINGCGKSTVLRALASKFQADALKGRFYANDESSYVQYDVTSLEMSREFPVRLTGDSSNPYQTLERQDRSWTSGFHTYDNTSGSFVRNFIAYTQKREGKPLITSLFSYSGSRAASIISTKSLKREYEDITIPPLWSAADFDTIPQSNFLAIWIKNKKFEATSAQLDGDENIAAVIGSTMAKIEETIRQITGWDVHFTFRPSKQEVFCRIHGKDLEFDVLPDGVKSIIGWVADLFMRLDRLPWIDDRPLWERSFILLLDEIEIHLHPKWQRQILPVLQGLFPNAQIFIATHSPFVVGSVRDAWVYKLDVVEGKAVLVETVPSMAGESYLTVINDVFGISSYFDIKTEQQLQRLQALRNQVLRGDTNAETEWLELAKTLADLSEEVELLVMMELKQLEKHTGRRYAL